MAPDEKVKLKPSWTRSNKEKKSKRNPFVKIAVLNSDGHNDPGYEHHVGFLQILFSHRIGCHYSYIKNAKTNQCGYSQNFLLKFLIFFVTLGLKILSLLRKKVVFETYVIKRLILTTVKIVNYSFYMINCSVKASKSYANS